MTLSDGQILSFLLHLEVKAFTVFLVLFFLCLSILFVVIFLILLLLLVFVFLFFALFFFRLFVRVRVLNCSFFFFLLLFLLFLLLVLELFLGGALEQILEASFLYEFEDALVCLSVKRIEIETERSRKESRILRNHCDLVSQSL